MSGDTDDAKRRKWTAEQWIQLVKEIVTAIIGLGIVGYTLGMTTATLGMVGDPNKLPGAKDLLLLFLSLTGVVLGYYFGRVPADARSAQAQQQATDATARIGHMGDKAEEISQQLGTTMEKIRGTPGFIMDKATDAELEHMHQQLRGLSDMARMR